MAVTPFKPYLVSRHDNPLRYTVSSASRPEIKHLVDLGEHGGLGHCSCENFGFRILPRIEANERAPRAELMCGHILAAREALTDDVIQRLAGNQTEAEKEPEQ